MRNIIPLFPLAVVAMTSLADMADALAERQSAPEGAASCPDVCFCNSPSHIVYCSRRGLTSIPAGVPADTLQLNLNGNLFTSTTVTHSNVSRYAILEHLYLSECGLEAIEVGAFSELVQLRWLDLSNNRIKAIEPRTFDGLTLQHLFINGNRNVRIVSDSFSGLATTGLYLHDCSLDHITPESIVGLNFTLRYLWLNGNELERLDPRLRQLFDVLLHLRLGLNPLRCNCWAVWLKQFYDESPDMFKGALPPTCLRPNSLKGRHFSNLTVQDLRCQGPMFSEVEATFDDVTSSGRLRCVASGDPAPVLYWIQPTGKATRYSAPPAAPDHQQLAFNEAVLELDPSATDLSVQSRAGMYICVADNDAGNATLTISLPSPYSPNAPPLTDSDQSQGEVSKKSPVNAEDVKGKVSVNSVEPVDYSQEFSGVQVRVRTSSESESGGSGTGESSSSGRFTVTQMTLAVLGTHLTTLAVCLLLAALFCLRSRLNDDAKDIDRRDDDEFDTRHLRHFHSPPPPTGNTLVTGNDVKKMAPDVASETVYLRLNGMHPYRCAGSYFSDTTTSAVSMSR